MVGNLSIQVIVYSSKLHTFDVGASIFNQINFEINFPENTKPKKRWMALAWPILRCWNDSSRTNDSLTSRYAYIVTHTHTHAHTHMYTQPHHACQHSVAVARAQL